MERLCDEILQLIFFELNDPSALTVVCKRFYYFSQDPYVRAHYFLTRYGEIQAMFWALGRGRVMNNRTLDILLASGAHLSRYLIQVAIHHYFRTTAHFIKTTWVRSVPFPVFNYFLKLAADMYGDVPVGKTDDDGSVFASFLKESRFPSNMKSITWEEIRDILEKYKFIPFSNKDPIMVQFPLALAVEPRLLPYAVANGFQMDAKYRDFVFRKMFERPAVPHESRTDEIIHNVRELSRLDSTMFLSRTVAAEVCMEAKSNELAYSALKKLDQSGELLFELSTLVEDLIKLFVKTRSITVHFTMQVLRQLYSDFPSSDPTVRLVILLTIFLSDNCLTHTTPASLKSKFEPLGLLPLTRKDIYNVLLNPFVERYFPILEFTKAEVGLGLKEIRALVEEVAVKCLELGCKGKTLRKFVEGYPFLHDTIATVVMQCYQIEVDDLPPHEDEKACAAYEAKLCRDFIIPRFSDDATATAAEEEADEEVNETGYGEGDAMDEVDELAEDADENDGPELGRIGQDTLSAMIRQDELAPTRSRRRAYYSTYGADVHGKLNYPSDPLQVGKWIKEEFGLRSSITAIFMTHAVLNDNSQILHQYLMYSDNGNPMMNHVPVTLKHFKLLARLGRAPSWCLFHDIELGAEFYFSEEDYLTLNDGLDVKKKPKVKIESTTSRVKLEAFQSAIPSASCSKYEPSPRGKKRPRRTAAVTIKSYVVPDSDDEAIVDEGEFPPLMRKEVKSKKVESNLQRWIKHLSILLKEEQRKYKEKKKRIEKAAPPDEKVRVPRNEFFKSLSTNLRSLRKKDMEKRVLLYGPDVADEDPSEGDDDEYQYRTTRGKRRKSDF